jgi:membrane protease YdiL (CAAX protease family)
MSIKDLFEPVLLFFVIFFAPAAAVSPLPEAGAELERAFQEIQRSLFFRLPAFLLILRLADKPIRLRPGSRDLWCGLLAFLSLAAAGFGFSLAAQLSGLFPAPPFAAPESAAAWIAAILSSLSSGYLEESYFRVYLLTRLSKAGTGVRETAAVSALLFGFCHIYEGPWGAANAVLAGLILSVFFMRYRVLHGIALAHSFYNIFVYAAMAFWK